MIMTIGGLKNNEKSLSGKLTYSVFQRLYAAGFYHTVTKKGRTCKSCHSDPAALGYGRGKIYFREDSSDTWSFKNHYDNHKEDGLPQDAWIPFLKKGFKAGLSRNNIRPFSFDEQKRILKVGRCLQCHNKGIYKYNSYCQNHCYYKSHFKKKSLPSYVGCEPYQ
jgi:hypothetical protein